MNRKELMQSAIKGDPDAIRELRKQGVLKSPRESEKKEWIVHPVSRAQRRLWVLSQTEQASIAYNIPEILLMEGNLDRDVFERAFAELTRRHESLRTTFEYINGELYQKIHDKIDFKVNFTDMADEAVPDECAPEFIRKEITRAFDLTAGPLFRVSLLKLSDTRHVLVFNIHHIVSDIWSMNILAREFCVIYDAFRNGRDNPLQPLRIHYKDYAAWQNRLLESEDITVHQQYWHEKLSGEIPALNLPTDLPRPQVRTFEGRTLGFLLSSDQAEQLRAFAREKGITLFITLLAALKVLLYRYTGQEDIIIGSPVAGRSHADLDDQVGFYVNTLALRDQVKGENSFIEFMQEVKQTVTGAFDHQVYPFDMLTDELELRRDPGRSPLFDVMIGMEENQETELVIEGLCITPFVYEYNLSKFDMIFVFVECKEGLRLDIEYNTDLFMEHRARQMGAHFSELVTSILNDPDSPVRSLNILPESEYNRVVYEFNSTAADYPRDSSIVELFEEQAEKTPNAVALVFKDQEISYGELNARANQLAHFLRKKGISPGSITAIIEDRSPEMIITIFGILKAGGAYLPLDIQSPTERMVTMLNDSRAPVLLCREDTRREMDFNGEIIMPDKIAEQIALENSANPDRVNKATDLAYVMYTSGSTGEPKGVLAEHRGIVRLVRNTNYTDIKPSDRILQLSNYAFDGSTYDIYGAFINGASLYLVPGDLLYSVDDLCSYISENRINITFITTALFNKLVDTDPEVIRNFDKIFFGGQDASLRHVRKSLEYRKNKDSIVHVYGPTENTTFSTYYVINEIKQSDTSIPIGASISNSRAYILNDNLYPVPVGIEGELYVSGDGLSRGYLNKEVLTSEKFLCSPFIPGEKLYKTGDIAKWLPDGNIDFLGRKDNQVKVRGFRIEIGEVENTLLKHPLIRQCFVMPRQTDDGNKELVAYIVGDQELSITDIRDHMLRHLPDYMIPACFAQIPRLPLNSTTGKVDRNQLPDPGNFSLGSGTEYEAPRNELELQLALIWQELLNREQIGIHDNYFAIGGDSIKAIQVTSRLSQKGYKLELVNIFKHPTISELAGTVTKAEHVIDQDPVTGTVPLLPVQSWFFQTHKRAENYFNQSVMLCSKERLQEDALRAVFEKIQEHHDALRMRFGNLKLETGNLKLETGNLDQDQNLKLPIQENCGLDYPLSFEVVDLEDDENAGIRMESYANQVQAGITLNTGPLMKVVLFRLKDGDRLLIVIHHLVIDGVSWRILSEDLVAGYKQYLSGEPIKFPLKTDSFKQWAEQVQQHSNSEELLKEKEYWKTLESIQASPLPRDYEAASEDSFSRDTRTLSFDLSQEDTGALLTKVNHAYSTEINDILLTALARAMNKWHGDKNTLITLEGHGREKIADTDISRTVGWFTSMYPVVLELPGSDDLGYQIKHIKEMLRKVPDKGMGYGILKYITPLEHKQDMSFNSLPRISFNYLGQFDEDTGDLFQIASESGGNDISPESEFIYDIDINSMVTRGQLQIALCYNQKIYKHETIEKIGTDLKNGLLDVIKHCISVEDSEITPDDIDYDGFGIDELDSFLDNL